MLINMSKKFSISGWQTVIKLNLGKLNARKVNTFQAALYLQYIRALHKIASKLTVNF